MKITEDGAYARKMLPKMNPHKAVTIIRKAGGAARLKVLAPEIQRLLLGVKS